MMYLVSFKNEKIETASEFDNMKDLNMVKDTVEKMSDKFNLNITMKIYNETEWKTIYKEFGNDIKFLPNKK
jgi:hypothetical protein